MNDDSTENPARLPLAERAGLGLLLSEPLLSLDDVAELEHPADSTARKALAAALSAAIRYGDLAATIQRWQRPGLLVNRSFLRLPAIQQAPIECSETRLDRNAYRAWRITCPPELLSPLSKIHKWLGATPASESILPATSGKRQRIDALGNAIQAALAVLSPSGSPLPRPHELFDYLATADSTRTITGVAKGNRELFWIDDNGNEQTLTFPALGKRLDRLKEGD